MERFSLVSAIRGWLTIMRWLIISRVETTLSGCWIWMSLREDGNLRVVNISVKVEINNGVAGLKFPKNIWAKSPSKRKKLSYHLNWPIQCSRNKLIIKYDHVLNGKHLGKQLPLNISIRYRAARWMCLCQPSNVSSLFPLFLSLVFGLAQHFMLFTC